MRSRFMLLAVALPVLAAAPVHAQTIFKASGGNIVLTPDGMEFTPFQLFYDALGVERLVASSDGTSFTLDTKGSVAIGAFPDLGSLNLGFAAPGSGVFFRYVINGRSYNTDDFYRQILNGFSLDYADVTNGSSGRFRFTITGVSSADNLQCPGAVTGPGGVPITCTLLNTTPVTSTPEPGTIALFATGLAGLIPVVIRRRRAA